MALLSLASDFPFPMAALTSSSVSVPLPRSRPLRNPTLAPLTSFHFYSFPVSLRFNSLITSRTAPLDRATCCMLDSKAPAVTKDSWNKMVMNSEIPVLVEFYANWCGPCRMVHRLIDEIATEYGGRLQCYVLNTDKDLQVAEDYEIKAVPVVMLFKNGEKRETVVGTMPKDFYVAAIERVLKQQ